MGNIFSIQCGDALVGRCWDCIAKKSQYISQLGDNLDALEAARDRLLEKMNDVRRTVINQQRPQMEQSDQVAGWLSTVDLTISEVSQLITRGAQERQKLCMAGCCSNNCMSTYKFGKSVAKSLIRVNALMARADFSRVVVNAPAKQLEFDLQKLSDAKADLQARKQDLQQRISSEEGPGKQTLEQVKVWMSKAESLVAEADKLMKDSPQELEKLLGGDISSAVFVGNVARKIEDILSLHLQGDFSQVTARAVPRGIIGRNHRPAVGNEDMLEEAWRLLHTFEVDIIGIYGMGGVGKTTLLTQINNKFVNTPNGFDAVIWIVVSKDLKLDKIQESIWKQIRSLDEGWLQKSFQEKAQDIFDLLQRKKFVLLLDDLWQQFDLEEIGIPLPNQQNGSKVVMTTRSFFICKQMEAVKTMKVKPLNQEEAWQLFKEKVGKIDANILDVAQKVAEECRGLPIALITIGRAMASRSTIEEWEHALNVLRRSVSNLQGMEDELYQGMEVHVFKRLKFSYDSLPNNILQSCFLYCSLFPEDFKILKDDLVHYWLCEKFCSRGEGYNIIYTLIRQCLLEEEGEYVKMHDVIRDMALWIASKCEKERHKFFIQAGAQLTQLPETEEWKGAKKVSLMANSFVSIEGSPKCCDPVTLFLSHSKLSFISEGFFRFMTKLMVLDLSHTKIEVLPSEITHLQSLEFLNLSYTNLEKLPSEMKSLLRLKYLNLERNAFLEIIPVQVIPNLSKLQVLNLLACGSALCENEVNNLLGNNGNMLLKELMCLKNLCELSLTVKSAFLLHNICRNQILLNCTRALHLCFLEDTKSLNISALANAKQLRLLDIFTNHDLEELIIEERSTHAPGSSLNSSFPGFCGLREVNVINNNNIRHITILVFAPHLTILRVGLDINMEEIIRADKLREYRARGEHVNIFPKLQVLDLDGLPQLKVICAVALSFPCLRHINVRQCQSLKKLPLNSESAGGGNVVIKAEESWWSELTWEDPETQAAFSSCYKNM